MVISPKSRHGMKLRTTTGEQSPSRAGLVSRRHADPSGHWLQTRFSLTSVRASTTVCTLALRPRYGRQSASVRRLALEGHLRRLSPRRCTARPRFMSAETSPSLRALSVVVNQVARVRLLRLGYLPTLASCNSTCPRPSPTRPPSSPLPSTTLLIRWRRSPCLRNTWLS